MDELTQDDQSHRSSTGHQFSGSDWLDVHFEWMRPEYEDMLRWVGLQPGWRVLDAACGPGSFLPLMTELVTPGGYIDAIDIAPENINVVKQRIAASHWPTPVTPQIGSILDLPYADGIFDAVWCANTTQYLSDDELRTLLRECIRVTRPGGLIAIKDYDFLLQQIHPTLPMLGQHFNEAMLQLGPLELRGYFHNLFRVVDLPRWLREAGLSPVRQRPTFMLRQQPLTPEAKAFCGDFIKFEAPFASSLGLSEEEQAMWRKLADFDAPDHPFNHPDFQYRCIQTIFVGVVPSG